mgnify:CR=1 FL=1
MKYDQHFIIDFDVAKKIGSFLAIKDNEKVLEIGPGKGILTQFLKGNVTVIEIDKNLCEELKEKFPKINVTNANMLECNGSYDKIISNVPYSICEPLMNKLIKMTFKEAVLIVPDKFMEKGVLSLVMSHFFNIKKFMEVNNTALYPIPKRKSKVVLIEHKKLNEKEEFFEMIYVQSDKKLGNVLKAEIDVKKLNLEFLEKRIYQLNYNEWKEVVNIIGL